MELHPLIVGRWNAVPIDEILVKLVQRHFAVFVDIRIVELHVLQFVARANISEKLHFSYT